MKDKSTLVKYTREELAHVPDETDWEKVDAMSDEEVYQDARNDKDAQPTDKTFWEKAPPPSHNDGYVRHTPRIGWEITEVGRTDENTND